MGNPQRWHDRKPELAKAVHFLSALPEDLQTIIGDCVIQVAEKEYKVSDLLNSLKSMGTEKILGLHQSQKKRRSYDNNPTMHKAINCIYILPPNEQNKLVKKVLELMDSVVVYFEIHREFNTPAKNLTLKALSENFLLGGVKQATRFNQDLKATFQAENAKKTQLLEAQDGMVIRPE